MWALLFPFAKSVVLKAVESEQAKRLVVDVLKRIVARTDNDLDDLAVEHLEKALFPEG
jgi:hypothetical protein